MNKETQTETNLVELIIGVIAYFAFAVFLVLVPEVRAFGEVGFIGIAIMAVTSMLGINWQHGKTAEIKQAVRELLPIARTLAGMTSTSLDDEILDMTDKLTESEAVTIAGVPQGVEEKEAA